MAWAALWLPALLLARGSVRAQGEAQDDWRLDWELQDGFALNIDSDAYQLPTALAFVPNPGSGSWSPGSTGAHPRCRTSG